MAERLFTRLILLICLFILSGGQATIAQNESNPFDLQHRLPKNKLIPNSIKSGSKNPFDIESRPEPEVSPIEEEQKPRATIVPLPKKTAEKPNDTRSGFLFWMILGMMIYLALLVTLYRSLLVKIYRAFANENILKLLQREQSAIIAAPYLFLYILFIISAGILAFQVAYHYETISFEFKNLGYCILGVAVFFLLKHLLLKIIGFVFPVYKEVKQYSFTITVFSIILGIILIPFNIFIAFAQDSFTNPGIIGVCVALAAVYLYRALRGIFIGSKFLAFHKFHFFMYICTVEIAPSLIIIKLLLNGANIH
ncbi:MAG: hypothetical protein ACI8P3_002075 [Saprospiraceae bacterium]|jgi:hypothetical protein